MADFESSGIRISDAERESALSALGEHMSAGRLDIDEYGERSAKVTAAKTRADVLGLFDDLPAPHPTFSNPAGQPAAPTPAPPPPAKGRASQAAAMRGLAAIMPLAWIGAIALMVVLHLPWLVLFIPIALTCMGSAMWGKGWNKPHNIRAIEEEEQRRDHWHGGQWHGPGRGREHRRQWQAELRDQRRAWQRELKHQVRNEVYRRMRDQRRYRG